MARLLETARDRRIKLLVAPVILAEVLFVLESVYEWKRREIADRLLNLIQASVMEFMEQPAMIQALSLYRDSPALHLADAYIAALASERTDVVISLDRGLKRVSPVSVVDRPEELP